MLKAVILLLSITYSPLLLFAQSFDAIDSKNGLSNNQVNTIVKDERGFVWFGTMSGLNRYDGYNFKVFKHKVGDSTTINDDFINQVVPGPHHMLWVQTPNGWNIFNPQTEKFTARLKDHLNTKEDNFTAIVPDRMGHFWFVLPGTGLYKYDNQKNITFYKNAGNITALTPDHAGFIWIAYAEGIIEKRDTAYRLLRTTKALQQYEQKADYKLFADADNDLWIYSTGDIKGLYYYNAKTDKLMPARKDAEKIRLNNDIINGIAQDDKGNIWVATDHGGINLIDKKSFTARYIMNKENDPKSLRQNSVNTIYKDDNGIVWVGTFKKGVNYFHESNLKFPLYQHPNSFVYNDVNRFVEDKKGNLWIGTNGGGLIYYDRVKGTYKQYLHSGGNSLSNNVIVSLCIDKEDKLWIGTYYGGLDCFDGKQFINYKHDEKDPYSLADDRVWEIFEDSQQRLWIGTLSEGLELFDRKENKFIRYKRAASLSNYISSIMEDKDGNIWVGTDIGIDILDKRTGLFRHHEHIDNDTQSLSHNIVIDILQDSRGLIWIATRDGLNLYDPAKRTFKTYRTEDGLPDNTILTLLEDNHHHLWLSTPNGLSNVIVTSTGIQCKNYDEADGLQGRQFNENAALKMKDGQLLFGGANGFNLFQPSGLKGNTAVPQLALTGLQIFNTPIRIGEKYNGRVVLKQSITATKELILKYNQNVFSIEFAALAYLNANKIKYAYQLKGFSDEWLTTNSKDRKATFTNLNPGEYTLFVKASNEDGLWSKEPLALTIRILPPFWLTPFALGTYLLIIIAALIFSRKMILRRASMKFQIEQERQEAHRLHELDMMKIKFFTNVSHEFRTPLSLIITPVEKLMGQSGLPEEKKQFQLIHRNARRLLNMVNQLLDFRKLEEQELRLNKTSADIIRFLKELSYSFTDIAENKRINFSFETSQELLFTTFDQEKLERIMFNLLSNAFKFTPVGGDVAVKVDAGEKTLKIKVKDTGIGIAKDKQEKIFERFFQNEVPGSMVNQGSGIGLSITKEFVRLHGGEVTVESKVNEGSVFTVSLPITPMEEDIQKAKEEKETRQPARNKRKKTLLLVEDNDDFRFYIKDNLKEYYNIIEAGNGKIGWQKALADHPDLIVCDISMPEMNGIELCQKIRDDKRTFFIPVILLTALTGEEHQLEGLQTGASDYMTKPFNFEILLSKIKNLLAQQDQFKKTYQKQVQAQPSEIPSPSATIQQALAIVEKNISNADFSVEELSREMFMSRGALYKKMFSLTGQTPIEFIRSIRLQRAAQLLEKGEMTVAEVAYEVGFNNPKYFSKYFKDAFNVLPSAYTGANKKH